MGENVVPLSFSQERMWFTYRFLPEVPSSHIAFGFFLSGPFAVGAFEKALGEVVRRHEALRTVYPETDRGPVQLVRPPEPVTFEFTDLEAEPEAIREEEAVRLAVAASRRPFDLANEIPLRAMAYRLSERQHLIALSIHHIAFDGWSANILFDELVRAYEAFSAGRPSPLSERAEHQYRDFTIWQRENFAGEELERQLAYWKKRLTGAPEELRLPLDRPRPPIQSLRGARVDFRFPRDLSEAVAGLCQRAKMTPHMFLLAAFQAVLHRYTGQTDILVGTPIANRTRVAFEKIIGLFVNTVVLRANLAGDPTFLELVTQARDRTLESYEHQDLPFDRLVEELQPARDPSRHPIFQVMFAMYHATQQKALPGAVSRFTPLDMGVCLFDLLLEMRAVPDGFEGTLWYSADLFEKATIDRLASHYQAFIREAATNPASRVSQLSLLTPGERENLRAWETTPSEYPLGANVAELFEAEARRVPDAVAVSCGASALTYGELDRRAEVLAKGLRGLGVGPEVLAGVFLERSPEVIVALLGILKAGAAYVPLDPDYPPERLDFMVRDTGTPVILTQESLLPRLGLTGTARPGAGTRIICLDRPWTAELGGDRARGGDRALGGDQAQAGPPAPSRAYPQNLAYVMYTSGSTGLAKGVAVTHRAVVRLVKGATYADLGQDTAFLEFAPVSFDASTLEIWGPLLNGGRVVVAPPHELSVEEISEVIRDSGVTAAWLTAGLFNLVVESGLENLRGLRQLLFGGDTASVPHVERARAALPGCRLINGYGPTENTTFSTCYSVPEAGTPGRAAESPGGRRSVPIGRPVGGTVVHILDRHLAPAPVGVPGELYVGGDGLARGYHGRPELTAERFVPDPVGTEPGARLYRTGDLARWLEDGNIEFLGRLDFQVKVRGFRVELGEIEAALALHPGVGQAVATVREDVPGDKRLVAYVVPAAGESEVPGGALTGAALKRYLASRLPEYMVPSVVAVVEALPLGPTGKVDRKRLEPPGPLPGPERERADPRTPVEEVLIEMFRELLGAVDIGTDDNFFELGGHSLLATRLVSRLRRVFGVELPLRDFFALPTVRDLGRRVESLRRGGPASLPPIPRTDREGPLEVSFAQERLWFLDRFGPGSPAYNIPLALRLRGLLEARALEMALAEIVRRHETLRTVLPAVEGRPVQIVRPFEGVSLDLVDLDAVLPAEKEEAMAQALSEEAARPFDLSAGPLVRWTLVRLSSQDHVLIAVMHHVISDGWSVSVFFRELAALYEAFLSGAPSPLEELPVRYADFASWQRSWLEEGELKRQLGYWKDRLGGDLGVVDLPTDRPRPAEQSFHGDSISFVLPAEATTAMADLGRHEGATLFMILLAALDTLLYRYTGQVDISIGTPIANRNREEIEGLIGFFVNTLVLRVNLGGRPTFRQLLARVKEAALEAYDHQDVPFEVLVEALQPVRDVSRPPLFQTMLVLLNVGPWHRDFGGLKAELLEVTTKTAKFDLLLTISEAGAAVHGALEYNTDLFDRATMERFVAHYQAVLAEATANPDRPVSELRLMGRDEERGILQEWNKTARHYPRESCVHDLFRVAAGKTPQAVAAAFGDEVLTYEELDRVSDKLARRLRRLGAGPDEPVALAVKRSLDVPIAVLAILKAGAACLPLDPGYPRERLAFMVADAGARVLVAQEALAGQLRGLTPETVLLGGGWEDEEEESSVPETLVYPESLAYVIYTSGSTGQPKGVAVTHRVLVNLVAWQVQRFRTSLEEEPAAGEEGRGPAAAEPGQAQGRPPGQAPGQPPGRSQGQAPGRTLQFAPLSFDVAFQEMFATWHEGGTLVFVSEEERRDLGNLPLVLDRLDISRVFMPFVAIQQLAEAAARRKARPRSLREVITAGEQLQVTDDMRWFFAPRSPVPPAPPGDPGAPSNGRVAPSNGPVSLPDGPAIRLENQYGPSETHVATAYRLPSDPGLWPALPPIGRPVANARAYVLDKDLAPAPIGVPGELYLGGALLARGYWRRPDLTAAVFVPDPFGPEPGGRLYRTGDLARLRAGGHIEFLGRIDQQVKVRGFRVEPGEIEAVMAEHPSVSEAVVILRDDPPSGKRLIAYVVPSSIQENPVPELSAHLKSRLPEYMVPAIIAPVASLPMTPSGKVDRRALQSRPAPRPDHRAAYSPPETETEKAVAAIWREVLGVEAVGLDDNFFDLGGHSLLVVRVSSLLEEVFGRPFRVVDLFRYTTVRALAGMVSRGESGRGSGEEKTAAEVALEIEAAAARADGRLAGERSAADRRAAREEARRRMKPRT